MSLKQNGRTSYPGGPRAERWMERSQSRGGKTRGCFWWSKQECGVSLRGQGDTEEGEAGSCGSHRNATRCLWAYPDTQGDELGWSRGSLECRDRWAEAEVPGLSPHSGQTLASPAFLPSHLAVWVDKGELGQRAVGVPRNSLGEVGGEQEERNRTHGEKWFACCPSPMFLFSR